MHARHKVSPLATPRTAKAKFSKPDGWFSRRNQFKVENGGGRNSVPNPKRTAMNKEKKEAKEKKAMEKGEKTRAETRAEKQAQHAATQA